MWIHFPSWENKKSTGEKNRQNEFVKSSFFSPVDFLFLFVNNLFFIFLCFVNEITENEVFFNILYLEKVNLPTILRVYWLVTNRSKENFLKRELISWYYLICHFLVVAHISTFTSGRLI